MRHLSPTTNRPYGRGRNGKNDVKTFGESYSVMIGGSRPALQYFSHDHLQLSSRIKCYFDTFYLVSYFLKVNPWTPGFCDHATTTMFWPVLHTASYPTRSLPEAFCLPSLTRSDMVIPPWSICFYYK